MAEINDVLSERGKRYGEFMNHAMITQALKSVIDQALFQKQKNLAPDMREALDMVCHKIGRIINGDAEYLDSWVDIAGYTQLVINRLEREERARQAKHAKPDLTLIK